MGFLLTYTTEAGTTELAFSPRRKDDAFAQSRAAIADGAKDVELLDNGQPVPRSEYAPKPAKRAAAAAEKGASKSRRPPRKTRG